MNEIERAIETLKRVSDLDAEYHLNINNYDLLTAIEALREKQERENPKPLTLEELREMDGEPVWTVAIGADNVYTCEIIGEFSPGPDNREVVSICGLEEGRYDVFADLYGKTWTAYRNSEMLLMMYRSARREVVKIRRTEKASTLRCL